MGLTSSTIREEKSPKNKKKLSKKKFGCCTSVRRNAPRKVQSDSQLTEKQKPDLEKESTFTNTKVSLTNQPFKSIGGSLSQDIRKVYKFKDVLGGGHFGSVRVGYRRDENPRKYYAIKSICLSSLKENDISELVHEVEIISHLQHPNIIKFYETYYDESYFHIVMELCKGKDVFEKIVEHGQISEQLVANIILKVLRAISYCHSKGITHRDLKPENILFLTNDVESEIKIIDFGLSRKYDSNEKMSTILGTPYYIAPEVLKGNYDNKCDIWSIGAMTYIMLSGDLPFNGHTNQEIFNKIVSSELVFDVNKWKNISEDAIDFIKKSMIKSPEKRLSAREAVSHPWFSHLIKESHHHKYLSRKLLNNLRNFDSQHNLKNIILYHIAKSLKPSETKKLKEAFHAIDLDHTGHITIIELEKAYQMAGISITKEELRSIVTKISKERGDGDKIDYSHFLIAAVDQDEIVTKDNLKKVFNYFDINGDGFIDSSDLKQVFLRAGFKMLDEQGVKFIISEVSEHDDKIQLKHIWKMFGYI